MKKAASIVLCCTLFFCLAAPRSAFSEGSNIQSDMEAPINKPLPVTEESYVSSDGEYYYDAIHDVYYSNFVRVIDGVITEISPTEYAAEVAVATENALSFTSLTSNTDNSLVSVGSQTFADGYYFLVQRSAPFYESDLNES